MNTYLRDPGSGLGGSRSVRPWGMKAKVNGAGGIIGREKGSKKRQIKDVGKKF